VQIVIAGGDGVSYGKPAPDGKTWRQAMLAEIGEFDSTRVHFSGTLGYRDYLALLQVSSVHCYLTVPFVLSWSCMEALSAGCIVVASRTAPVQEVIEDGRNGFLVPFAEPGAIAARICDALRERSSLGWMAARARQTMVESYDLARCLPQQVSLVRALA
jgi:glycosyltransferase involved in cell wall biosynthesis